jgi:hypothetical protein
MEQGISWALIGMTSIGMVWWFIKRWMEIQEKDSRTLKKEVGDISKVVDRTELRLGNGNQKFLTLDGRVDHLEQNTIPRFEFESRMSRQEDSIKQNKIENKIEHEEIKSAINELRVDVREISGDLRETIHKAEGAVAALQDVAKNLVTIANPGQKP